MSKKTELAAMYYLAKVQPKLFSLRDERGVRVLKVRCIKKVHGKIMLERGIRCWVNYHSVRL